MRDMSPQEAADRWVDKKRSTNSKASVSTLHYRLKQFVQFCEREDIGSLADITSWDIDDYEDERAQTINTLSLNKQLVTLRQWLEWCETRDLVDEAVVEAIEPPKVPKQQKSSDIAWHKTDAIPQIKWYRAGNIYGSRQHVVLEIAWHVGCRLGAIRSLDVRDFAVGDEEAYLDFVHRPESGTPLKNKTEGERPVALRPAVADTIETYLNGSRTRVRDDFGREPLITTTQGRASRNTIREDCYFGTAPCLRGRCPHNKPEQACEYWEGASIASCPSTRSPHQIRTGSISWQLDQGVPLEVVSKRANASPEVIKDHYDKSDPLEEMRKRRQPHISKLDLEKEGQS